jgi:hypothetical protein
MIFSCDLNQKKINKKQQLIKSKVNAGKNGQFKKTFNI